MKNISNIEKQQLDFLELQTEKIKNELSANSSDSLINLIGLMPNILEQDLCFLHSFWNQNWENQLKKTPQFQNVEKFVIVQTPVFNINTEEGSKIYHTSTITLTEEVRFKGTLYLYACSLNPIYYHNSELFNQVFKKKALFTPVFYNPENFVPTRNLILNFELPTSSVIGTHVDKITLTAEDKVKLVEQLLKVLDNPINYKASIPNHISIRGVFEYENNGLEKSTPLTILI